MSKNTSLVPTTNHVGEIVKRLERNTAAGAYLSQVFSDWLDLTHATLSAVSEATPAHTHSAAKTGRLAQDTLKTITLFARMSARYPQAWAWQNFHEAFAILLDGAEGFWSPDLVHREACGWDTIGAVYMATSAKEHVGQFFTPWSIAETMPA